MVSGAYKPGCIGPQVGYTGMEEAKNEKESFKNPLGSNVSQTESCNENYAPISIQM